MRLQLCNPCANKRSDTFRFECLIFVEIRNANANIDDPHLSSSGTHFFHLMFAIRPVSHQRAGRGEDFQASALIQIWSQDGERER